MTNAERKILSRARYCKDALGLDGIVSGRSLRKSAAASCVLKGWCVVGVGEEVGGDGDPESDVARAVYEITQAGRDALEAEEKARP